jgi:uncharacterized protein YdhG (YjbR/CyaY superfamily)
MATTTVPDYIAKTPPVARRALKQLRTAIKAAAPGITERISYRIPTFELDGRYLLYIAAFKEHVSVYPVTAGMVAKYGKALAPYRARSGSRLTRQFQPALWQSSRKCEFRSVACPRAQPVRAAPLAAGRSRILPHKLPPKGSVPCHPLSRRPGMLRPLCLTGLISVALATSLCAQTTPPASMDALLEHLVGRWIMTGSVRGKPATYTLDAARVLQGRFVELHMEDVTRPPAYEARVFIGVDSAGGRYIAHWLDRFGAAYSIPHATGEARGDTVLLTFPYSGGAFRDTFVYDRRQDRWYFRLEAADSTQGRRLFAEYRVRHR